MSDKFLTRKEREDRYPLMCKVFGHDSFQVELITEHGKSCAHMVFAPEIERVLEKAVKQKLWDAFTFEIKSKRTRK